jgi:sarcosine oxidase subunit gamma
MVDLARKSAFAGLLAPAGPSPAGVFAAERVGLGLAMVEPRRGRGPELSARVEALYGLTPPSGPARAAAGPVAFLGLGPSRWLASSEDDGDAFAGDLAFELEGVASVIAQTGGLGVLRISGPRARDAFAKGLPIDLDPSVFPVGVVASSILAHIPVTLWRPDEAGYEVAVARSFAGDFWHWLATSAGEFGLAV